MYLNSVFTKSVSYLQSDLKPDHGLAASQDYYIQATGYTKVA